MEGQIKIHGDDLKVNPTYLPKDLIHWAPKNKYSVKGFIKLMREVAPPLIAEFKRQFTVLKPTAHDLKLEAPTELDKDNMANLGHQDQLK